LHGPLGRGAGRVAFPRRELRFNDGPCRFRRMATQPIALALDPSLEHRRAAHEEAIEKIATILRKRLDAVSTFGESLELRTVQRDGAAPDTDLLRVARDEHVGAELLANDVKRLAQRRPCMLLAGLGPEHRQQRVSTTESIGCRGREIHQHRETLRLREQASKFRPGGVAQVDVAERS